MVIAARNEQANICHILQDLEQQNYPKQHYEVIVIDDYSTDKTVEIVNQQLSKLNYTLRLISNQKQGGKKSAIEQGVAMARGNWILCTDADCRVGEQWIESMVLKMQHTNSEMIIGPVIFFEANTILSQLQMIEFAALVGSGAATLELGIPSMCNGANLAYQKAAFERVKGFDGNRHLLSGDDEFLMHKIFSSNRTKISFNYCSQSVVKTKAQATLYEFIQQRKRWSSKWNQYQLPYIKWIAILIFIGNFNLLFLPLYLIVDAQLAIYLIGLQLLKTLVDAIFTFDILNKFGNKFSLKYFVILSLIYPIYVSFFGLSSKNNAFTWKNRTCKMT